MQVYDLRVVFASKNEQLFSVTPLRTTVDIHIRSKHTVLIIVLEFVDLSDMT